MTRSIRMIVLAVGVVGVGVALLSAFVLLPAFGDSWHPYGDHAAAAALLHRTANVVSSINFDQRAFDTFGEEAILVGSVVGVAVLLRPVAGERRRRPRNGGHVLDSTRMLVVIVTPLTLVLGVDVVSHGAITPGGGFQGGVVLATGLHLLYVGGQYGSFARLRPIDLFGRAEATGVIMFAAIGALGLAVGGTWLANVVPTGTLGRLISGGTVPLLNGAVGLAVGGSIVVLLSHFLEQRFLTWPPAPEGPDQRAASAEDEERL